MTQSAEQHQPRDDSSGTSMGTPSPDIVLSPDGPGAVREAANPDPQIAAIRGEGIPFILYDGLEAPQHAGSRRRGSEASETSHISNMTIWDRGEAQYRAEHPLESPRPANGVLATPTNESPEPLVDRLLGLRTESGQSNGAFFYPRGEVEALITADEVARVIKQGRFFLGDKVLTDDEIREYASRVCLDTLPDGTRVSYKRVFAILLLLRRGWNVVLFVDEHICDAQLPLKAVLVSGKVRMRHRRADADLPCLRNWDNLAHSDFEQKQWSMLAPFLAKPECKRAWFYQLSDKVVLPWTSKKACVREGGYGSISKVKIHASHHNFDGGNGFFAVKEFKPIKSPPTSGADLSKDFEREIEILMRFSGDVHNHLISLQAAYRHGDTYCVILPWADCDLKAFWKQDTIQEPLAKRNLAWLLSQCVGIASGLQKIHRYVTTESTTDERADVSPHKKIYGRHGDIKPENILLFRDHENSKDLGRLVLADFGLSRFHSEITKTYFTYKDIVSTVTYRPPECDMEERHVSRSFDIWSLGCVLLEFVAWYLGGWNLVTEFVTCRQTFNPLYPNWLVDDFFEIVRQERSSPGTVFVRVKCEVQNFVDNTLHAHPKCSKPIHDLLDLVMEKMLVVESKDIGKRADCTEVHTKLQNIYQKVQTMAKYTEFRTHSGMTKTLNANGRRS
ncbi:kinase-like domain-containing protein [Chaetomium strumarium]|uniref:Kinase-like domain-containing protein n=1 Tax=Chaetomium strumarium TaxID=1170767 RepID=A0AAJ0GRP1_9PEZI|nr:kinase-like domain-containing protein [Chaetomium strumarium]